mmetsp:Transcript_11593/g.32098  ORF Transcript_11593/g.32098 Transcript_11593/m.32098 type:complete len:80 (+) Transcript_11593:501-740(+)
MMGQERNFPACLMKVKQKLLSKPTCDLLTDFPKSTASTIRTPFFRGHQWFLSSSIWDQRTLGLQLESQAKPSCAAIRSR